MAKIERLKERLVQQAVQDNIDSIDGKRPLARRRGTQSLVVLARILFFILIPAALFASTFIVSSMSPDWRGTNHR